MNRIRLVMAAACLMAVPALAQTAAELLQKGIYTQETAGDLDGAIAIYRQIVNSGNSPRDVAAQAQYRLAQSLLQKGDLADGASEFSNLARNYADYGKLISSLAAQARGNSYNLTADPDLPKRIELILSRMKAANSSPGANGAAGEETLLEQGLASIERGDYEAGRSSLNSLAITYPNSEYLARAKLGIIQSWMLEGGSQGLSQAQAEYNDFIRFHPDLAGTGGRGGRGPAARTAADPAALRAAIEKLNAQEQAFRAAKGLSRGEQDRIARDAELRAGDGSPASIQFDVNSPVTVKGVLFKQTMLNPIGAISVDPMDGTGRHYTFFTASSAELATQGVTKSSLRMGDQITVTGVLASGSQTLSDGTIAARADTITTSDGRKLFDRASARGLDGFIALPFRVGKGRAQ